MVLGIDLGTSAVKTLVVGPDGATLGRGEARYPTRYPRAGWAEQAPESWWEATVAAVRAALQHPGVDGTRVEGVGLSGQLNGVVFVDGGGRVIRDAIIWFDQRAEAEAAAISQLLGERYRRTTYGDITAVSALAKWCWVWHHEPEVAAAARHVLFPKDFLLLRLTGERVTDVTNAGAAGMLDMRSRRWATDFVEAAGLPVDLLPELVESPTVVGRLSAEAAALLGLRQGIPVVAGAGDMAALTVGAGVIAPGLACGTIGTAGHIAAFAEHLPRLNEDEGGPRAPGPRVPDHRVWIMPHAVPGAYFWHGLVMTAGHCLAWFKDAFGQAEVHAAGILGRDAFDLLTEPANHVPPGARGLLFLPFLQGAATPFQDPRARGCFIGATGAHGKAEFVRAVLEGVALNFRDSFHVFAEHGVPVVEVRAGEGGSRSAMWLQIMADVLGCEVVVLEEPETSALGAAILGAVGVGLQPGFEEACRSAVRLGARFRPDVGRHAFYTRWHATYRAVYEALRPHFAALE